jgi:hypothetical protein
MATVKSSPIILYLIVILGAVLGWLYNNSVDPSADVPAIAVANQMVSLRGLDSLNIDYSLMDTAQFQALRVYGELPVRAEGGGSSNPFQ